MPVWSVEGRLGTGKTKFAVWMAQQALRQGRRVASNVELNIGKLTPERAASFIRIPDKPSAWDLECVGHGNPESYDEERNGVMILDELGTWLNSRAFQDKDRAGVIDWMIHARKLGWDVFLIVQDSNMIDRQVREALIEYQCRCLRLDKVRIPMVGWLLGSLNKRWAYFPRMHMVTARVGYGPGAIVAERWMYRGDDLHAAYDTRQRFSASWPDGAFCVMPWKPPPVKLSATQKAVREVIRFVANVRPSAPAVAKPDPVGKPPRLALLCKLPLDERVEVWKRWHEKGLLPQA